MTIIIVFYKQKTLSSFIQFYLSVKKSFAVMSSIFDAIITVNSRELCIG